MANQKQTTTWKPKLPPYRRYKKAMHEDPIVTGRFIYQIGESDNLRQESSSVPIDKITSPEYQKKIAYLRKCILDYKKLTNKGRAIAAVQVGIPEHMIVVLTPERKQKTWILINPVITNKSHTILRYPEMCMSCNSMIATVDRPAWIEFTYYDENGEKHIWNTKDNTKRGRMYNRVLQHEIDHLHGIINIDLVPSRELIFISDPHFYEKADFEEIHPQKKDSR